MDKEFDLNEWNAIAIKLKREFPQLTNADLIWRHESKADFYKMIATDLGVTTSELERTIEQL
ncbi:hypothetical protein [Mangrovibacterium sp.]|uniref:hypothetical protein n=1 Tax=Mangrovibacterium sp. TaxID=1961364 RepID=UPI00356B2817